MTTTTRRPRILLEDVLGLLEQGVHPAMIAKQLGVTAGAIHKAAWRHGDCTVMQAFAGEYALERRRRERAA